MAEPIKTNVELRGDHELKHLFDELPKRIKRKALRKAVDAAAAPIQKQAKKRVRKRHGFLKKGIKRKLKTYKNTGNVVAIIGVDRNATGTNPQGRREVPANYMHLIESGHKGPHPAPAYPFLIPAYEQHAPAAGRIAQAKLLQVYQQEAQRLRAKGKK